LLLFLSSNADTHFNRDGGWYGRGIYFSTYAMYCMPYFENRRDPALIISYVITGNAFPVNEDHLGTPSLLGYASCLFAFLILF
jgi:hypothetical protein